MTREQAKANLPFIQAFAEGKTIEWKDTRGVWQRYESLAFNGAPCEYRIKPDKKRVPLEMKDIPDVCWIRKIGNVANRCLVIRTDTHCVWLPGIYLSYKDLHNSYEYTSTPSDPTSWKPCWKEVD